MGCGMFIVLGRRLVLGGFFVTSYWTLEELVAGVEVMEKGE